MAMQLARQCAHETGKFGVSEATTRFMHKTAGSYVGSTASRGASDAPPADSAKAMFLALVTPRQLKAAALAYQGFSQAEIAEAVEIDQTTVSRELRMVRELCRRLGLHLPEPLQDQATEEQLTDELADSLGI